jgi:hypothetical protein
MEKSKDIRLSEPLFTPRRVIVPPKPKKRKKRMTAAKKQRLEPSYTPQSKTEEEKQRNREYWQGKMDIRLKQELKNRARDVRYYKRQARIMMSDLYKKQGKVKTCIDCKVEYAYSFFDYHDNKEKGAPRKSYCYKCRKKRNEQYYDANKEKIKEKARIYYEKNKEKRKQKFKENYQRRAHGHVSKGSEPK